MLFIGTESMCKYVLCCKSQKMNRQIEIYNKGVEKIENDFDMYNYAAQMHDLKKMKTWVSHIKK